MNSMYRDCRAPELIDGRQPASAQTSLFAIWR
jgi:hypothetical protein